jgi:hypothetical protein
LEIAWTVKYRPEKAPMNAATLRSSWLRGSVLIRVGVAGKPVGQ